MISEIRYFWLMLRVRHSGAVDELCVLPQYNLASSLSWETSMSVLFGSPFGLTNSSEKDLLISCLEVDGVAANILEAERGKGTGQCSKHKHSLNYPLSVCIPNPISAWYSLVQRLFFTFSSGERTLVFCQ